MHSATNIEDMLRTGQTANLSRETFERCNDTKVENKSCEQEFKGTQGDDERAGYTREEIIQALTVIIDVCEENSDLCYTCPLADLDGECKIKAAFPTEWEIGEAEDVWRALK